VREQGLAIANRGNHVEYFLIKGKGLIAYFLCRSALLKKIKEFRPDIIHSHYGLSGIPAVLQNKVPVVITFHNGETLGFTQNLLSSLSTLRAKYVIYVAQHIYEKSYIKSRHYAIIPCGVQLNDLPVIDYYDARNKCGFLPNKKYVLFGGEFSNLRKNFPLLKEAVELLGDDSVVVLEMKGLSRYQLANIMSACDAFVLPTKSEGSPQALKEAMACGCPIVATDVADINNLLGNIPGHYICSFDPKDVAEKLLSAISFGKRTKGRDRIIELSLTNEQVADQVSAVYDYVLHDCNLKLK